MSLHNLFFVFATILALTIAKDEANRISAEFIDRINLAQTLWKAGRNFPQHTNFDTLVYLMGTEIDLNHTNALPIIEHQSALRELLPENFDSRLRWPKCTSIKEVSDQGSCGGCWAIAAVSTLTDRYCIQTNGTQQFHFSANDLISCCAHNTRNCTSDCRGGTLADAWSYLEKFGVVSGGNYNSSEGCKPYEIASCEQFNTDDLPQYYHNEKTPKCERMCQKNYNKIYQEDIRYGKPAYTMTGEADIKAEIFHNGPVTSIFDVYSDFLMYKSGVYRQEAGRMLGGHAIKIIGWGMEGDIKYWIVTNSWGTDWGDNGFFKILRGEYHCGIEGVVVAGDPIIKHQLRNK